MQELGNHQAPATVGPAGRIDAFGWGLIFIWAGIAVLADVGWRAGILVVGIIALGAQAARKRVGLRFDPLGLAIGVAMVAWGAWGFVQQRFGPLDIPGTFWPLVLIAAGLVLVVRAVRRGSPSRGTGAADVQQEKA